MSKLLYSFDPTHRRTSSPVKILRFRRLHVRVASEASVAAVCGHGGEATCDLGVAAGRGVLVDERGGDRGVTEAVHEFSERGTGLGGECGAGVS